MKSGKLLAGLGVAVGAVALTTGGAFAGAQLVNKPAPAVKAVTGILNGNCTQEKPSTRYSSAPSTDGCTITIPGVAFKSLPVPIFTTFSSQITSFVVSKPGTDWVIRFAQTAANAVTFSIESGT